MGWTCGAVEPSSTQISSQLADHCPSTLFSASTSHSCRVLWTGITIETPVPLVWRVIRWLSRCNVGAGMAEPRVRKRTMLLFWLIWRGDPPRNSSVPATRKWMSWPNSKASGRSSRKRKPQRAVGIPAFSTSPRYRSATPAPITTPSHTASTRRGVSGSCMLTAHPPANGPSSASKNPTNGGGAGIT